MTSDILREARRYEEIYSKFIPSEERPAFHLSPRVGWMNDPNGFSTYQGKYHLFYQYYPFDTRWGLMHWGHAVSKDLLTWEYLPIALAADEYYDQDGIFSGCALEMEDGRQLLVYTGVKEHMLPDGRKTAYQVQCAAIGDGIDYEKLDTNPIISVDKIPEGGSHYDFRDPKIWRKKDGSYRMLVGNRPADGSGQLLLYKSDDALSWEFQKVFIENRCRIGRMWECPDFFELDGKAVILVSPQDMLPEGFEYHNGNGTVCIIGSYDDETDTFTEESNHAVDYGIDFYAMQTIETFDGRRVMIGWMQNWDTVFHDENVHWFGQTSLPRELSIRDNRLYQAPVRELLDHRRNEVKYEHVLVKGCGNIADTSSSTLSKENTVSFEGVSGRMIDMELEIDAAGEDFFDKFTIGLAADEKYHTNISFRPQESIVKIDRKFSGSRRAVIHQRRAWVDTDGCKLKLRIILDRFSMEVFINDGRQVMTATLYTDMSADQIYFSCDKDAVLNITKYDLCF